VLRKAVKALEEMRPMFPINEITDAAVVLCKTAYSLCKQYVREEEILVYEHAKPRAASISSPATSRPFGASPASPRALGSQSQTNTQESPASTPPSPATPATLLQDYKALARCVTSNLDVLRSKPMFPGEQAQIQLVQAGVTKLEAATTELVTVLQQGVVNPSQVTALYYDLPANCREVMAAAEKLYVDRA